MIKKDGILYFETFLKFPEVVHGFSTRAFGDMRPSHTEFQNSLKRFSEALKFDPQNLVTMQQVHGNTVHWVMEKDKGNKLGETDGLLTSDGDVFLSVMTGDCIPVLLYDKSKHVVGAVHAGWRGVYKEIVKQAVGEMVNKGSNTADIMVGLGPAIRVCCYGIAKEHAEMFAGKFEWDVVVKRERKLFLDLPLLVKYQLRFLGIPDTNIEDSEICTYDSPTDLFSYRREGEGFGEFVGLIGKVLPPLIII